MDVVARLFPPYFLPQGVLKGGFLVLGIEEYFRSGFGECERSSDLKNIIN